MQSIFYFTKKPVFIWRRDALNMPANVVPLYNVNRTRSNDIPFVNSLFVHFYFLASYKKNCRQSVPGLEIWFFGMFFVHGGVPSQLCLLTSCHHWRQPCQDMKIKSTVCSICSHAKIYKDRVLPPSNKNSRTLLKKPQTLTN